MKNLRNLLVVAAAVAGLIVNTTFAAPAEGLSGGGRQPQYHFNTDGYRKMGQRMAVEMMKGLRAADLITSIKPRQRVISSVSVNSLQDNISVYTFNGKQIFSGHAVSGAAHRSMKPGNFYVVVNKATGMSTKLMMAPSHR